MGTLPISGNHVVVRDWDIERFYGRVRRMEAQGFTPRPESYAVMADIDPETGDLACLFVMQMRLPDESWHPRRGHGKRHS